MNKTLVIHPADPSTDFLSKIYEGRGWEVIRQREDTIRTKYIKERIKDNDRIIMLGHGTPYGLIGGMNFIINQTHVHLLREKELVGIWCNADQFFKKYGLNGFYTGMIISEVREANYLGIDTTDDEVNYSNALFTEAITESIVHPNMLERATNLYGNGLFRKGNPIIEYNEVRMYYR